MRCGSLYIMSRKAWRGFQFIIRGYKKSWWQYPRATRRLPFQKLLHRRVGEGATLFSGLLHFTLDTYLIMLSVKQGGIKYYFLKSLVWLDLGLNPGLPDYWRTLYPLGRGYKRIHIVWFLSSFKSFTVLRLIYHFIIYIQFI